jgi:hypothetical protein
LVRLLIGLEDRSPREGLMNSFFDGEGMYLNYARTLLIEKTINQAGWDNKHFWLDINDGPQLWLRVSLLETASISLVVGIENLENSAIIDIGYSYENIEQDINYSKVDTIIKLQTEKGSCIITITNISSEPLGALLYPCSPLTKEAIKP